MTKREMFLESPTGFMMPFVNDVNDPAVVMLGYGEQIHPATGKPFFHHGMDFSCDHQDLLAVASGLVTGMGDDEQRGQFIAVRYGRYLVRYAHISEAYAPYGAKVVAGQKIAKSGDFLHIDVRFDDDELNPEEFLTMIDGNMTLLLSLGLESFPEGAFPDVEVHTVYDDYQEEIMALLDEWFARYWADLTHGRWKTSEKVELIARNLTSRAADGNYLYKTIPSWYNPVGLDGDSGPLIGEMQNLIIEDFLGYCAARHHVYVPSFTEEQKKKLMTTQRIKSQ